MSTPIHISLEEVQAKLPEIVHGLGEGDEVVIMEGKQTVARLNANFMERELATNDFSILPISPRHTAILTELPFDHRDPFDRLLVAQAICEKIPLVSADPGLDAHAMTRLW